MNTDFEDRLREALAAEKGEVVVDEQAVLARGRASVRARRAGWAALGIAILALAVPVTTLLARQPTSAVLVPATSPTATASSANPLPSSTWRLSGDTGTWAGTDPVITLVIDGDRVWGSLGCGTYSGQVRQPGADRWIEARVATTHSCPYQTNARDSRYLETLNGVTTFSRATDPDRLVLDGSGGRLVFEPWALDGATWQLVGLGDEALGSDSGFTMVVEGDHLRGSAFCVGFTADLARDGQKWSVTNVQDVPGTAIPCPSVASEQMNRYFFLLEQVNQARPGTGDLTLSGPSGTLRFTLKN